MCGIFGWQLNPRAVARHQVAILATLLAQGNDRRGGDSFGFVNPLTGESIRGLGKLEARVFEVGTPYYLLGHTRKGTTGAITVDNCHPFDFGTLVGAHNGMITNHDEMNKKYSRKNEVDSMHIFNHLMAGLPLDELQGYGQIVYYHKATASSLKFHNVRNGDMHIRWVGEKGRGGLVFSSSDATLKDAMQAAGLPIGGEYELKEGKTYDAVGGVLYNSQEKEQTLSQTRYESNLRQYTSGGAGYGRYGYDQDMFEDARHYRPTYGRKRGKVEGVTPVIVKNLSPDIKRKLDYDSYEKSRNRFFEYACVDGACEPEDCPDYTDWKKMSDAEDAILRGDDVITVSPNDFHAWVIGFDFDLNMSAEYAFARYLDEFQLVKLDIDDTDPKAEKLDVSDEAILESAKALDKAVKQVTSNIGGEVTIIRNGKAHTKTACAAGCDCNLFSGSDIVVVRNEKSA